MSMVLLYCSGESAIPVLIFMTCKDGVKSSVTNARAAKCFAAWLLLCTLCAHASQLHIGEQMQNLYQCG